MRRILTRVHEFIDRNDMLESAAGVVIAVSGGADSIALADILVRIRRTESESKTPAKPWYRIAHLDHQLRGTESSADAEFVRSFAEKLGVPLTMARADVREIAGRYRRGIEEVGRELRYNFLLAVAREVGADRIATAHTMNDQAETIIMRMARGTGSRGLRGIRPVKRVHAFTCEPGLWEPIESESGLDLAPATSRGEEPEIPATHQAAGIGTVKPPLLIRPLLCVTRDGVEAYCRELELDYRTDVSNFSLDYTRNRIRQEVIPVLRSINPHAVEHIVRSSELAAGDQDSLDQLVSSAVEQLRSASASGVTEYPVGELLEFPAGIRQRIILELIRRHRRAYAAHFSGPVRPDQITLRHVRAIEALLIENASGKRLSLPGRLEVWREFDLLVIKGAGQAEGSTRPGEIVDLSYAGARLESTGELFLSFDTPVVEYSGLMIELIQDSDNRGRAVIGEARLERDRGKRDWMTAVLAPQNLPAQMAIRPRKAGESAHVLGGSRTKKLKKLMIDHRIPSSRRATWPVVATPDGRYIWSPGLPPAVEFAASDETQPLAILRASGV